MSFSHPSAASLSPEPGGKTVLLTSSSLKNKGDALMLRAVIGELGDRYRYALPSNVAAVNPILAREFLWCLCTDRPATTKKRQLFSACLRVADAVSSMAPTDLRYRTGLIRDSDVDICIDVSGYCYGDHWGDELIAKAARQYARYRKKRVPVILMPKTWGPFNRIRPELVNELIDSVDLAFARDQESLSQLRACVRPENLPKLHFAPDYTHEVFSTEQPSARSSSSETVYVIPSFRVIDSGAMSRDRYLSLLASARKHIEKIGAKPVLLIHETSSDTRFIDAAERLGFAREHTVQEEDPIKTKNIIAGARAVVTSRLHGLYNALNSGVPAVAIPWNFKYREALSHYGCEELLVDMDRAESSLLEKLDLVSQPGQRERISATMAEHAASIRQQTRNMWRLVHSALEASGVNA